MTEASLPRTDPDYKIASEIWNGVGGAGTNENMFLSGLKKIKTPAQFQRVNSQVAYFNSNLAIDEWVNNDFGSDNTDSVNQIINHLKSIGVDATAEFNSLGKFKENTFKITNIPTTTSTANTAVGDVAKGITAGLDATKKAIETGVAKKKQTTVTNPSAPAGLDVKKFQDWLDKNKAGWATGYKDGILNQGQNGGGYGRFGPRTQKQWNNQDVRKEYENYLKGGTTTKTTNDFAKESESVFGLTPDEFLQNN